MGRHDGRGIERASDEETKDKPHSSSGSRTPPRQSAFRFER